MNSISRTALRVRHETKARLLQVVRVEPLSPRMCGIVLGGDALDGFTSLAADDHVKLMFPAPGQEKPILPSLGPNGVQFSDGAPRPIMRDYTPRRFDPAANELTIEFLLHGDGPATSWAAQAMPGQWLGVGGPRGSLLVPEDFDAYLLAGDETALPAIARRLEEMRPGTRAIVLVEVADQDERRDLPTKADAAIHWLYRDSAPAGEQTLLLDALRSTVLPGGDVHAWLAGEIDIVRSLRAHLVDERGLPREQMRAAGYWRIGKADAHARIED